MIREMIETKDGSFTMAVPEMKVTYHSVHGAIQESRHVFINAGLNYACGNLKVHDVLHLLEIGLGTGLNALLTLLETEETGCAIHYTAIEPFPLSLEEIALLNYCSQLKRVDRKDEFKRMHQCEWGKDVAISSLFSFHKTKESLLHFSGEKYHLVYFDAFAPASQPDLWTQSVFENIYQMLLPGGVLVTYCCKGDVRRAMLKAGFMVEKLSGPPGKREMIRAVKT